MSQAIHPTAIVHANARLGESVSVGPYAVIEGDVVIGDGCAIGDGVVIANGTLLGGVVAIGDRAFISGAVPIHQFCRVGRFALLAASTRVNQDCLPFVITDGVPGRARGLNLVGLKRGGIPAAEVNELKRAFHALRTAASLEPALAEISSYGSPAASELVQFIRASKRGFAHPAT